MHCVSTRRSRRILPMGALAPQCRFMPCISPRAVPFLADCIVLPRVGCGYVPDSDTQVPLLTAACLHWVDERDAFAIVSALIREPSPLLTTRVSSWLFLEAFEHVAHTLLPAETAALNTHVTRSSARPPLDGNHPMAGVVAEWLCAWKAVHACWTALHVGCV
eukprot:m.541321 g.541321  ORF g.541321 m.541321 type:complete len:162 (+) comp22108_c0_seq3:1012-1497(+)